MRPRHSGTFFVFLAALLYSIGGLCIKVIPWSGVAINGGRTAIALVVMGLYFRKTGHRLRLNRFIALGAAAVCGTNILFSLANKMTTAANAIVLQYTAPIFVILLSMLFFARRPSRLDLISCAAVLGGVLCFFLDSLTSGNVAGDVIALASGVCYAGVFMLNDLPDSDPLSSIFFGHMISAVVGLPFLMGETDFSLPTLTSLVILGVFQVGLAFLLLTIGLRTTPPVTACLVSGIEPVLNPILVALFYHEYISTLAVIGAVIVIGSVLTYNVLLARRNRRCAAQTQ